MNSGIKGKKALLAKERKRLMDRALNPRTSLITIDELDALRPMTISILKANIGKVWPWIVLKVSQGLSVSELEAYLGLKRNTLHAFIDNYPRLKRSIDNARKIHTDHKAELDFMLS